jgi:WD40 repeat protein
MSSESANSEIPLGFRLCHTLRRQSAGFGTIGRISWSPDGQLLASPYSDGPILLWDAETGRLQLTLGDSNYQRDGAQRLPSAYSVAWSPSGQILASGFRDGTIRFWDVMTGSLIRTLDGHTDGQSFASASDDEKIKIWNPETGELQWTLMGHYDWVTSLVLVRKPPGCMSSTPLGSNCTRRRCYCPCMTPCEKHDIKLQTVLGFDDGVACVMYLSKLRATPAS